MLLPGLVVSRGTEQHLHEFSDMVLKWGARINLISRSDRTMIWQRHVLDSAQLLLWVNPAFTTWADMGSGGGFPAIVCAIILRETHPHARIVMIESDQRKAAFLRQCIRQFDLKAIVAVERAEILDPMHADIVTARAFAKLADLLPLAQRHLKDTGTAIFHKGRNVAAEIDTARLHWGFDLQERRSITDPTATILCLQGIRRV